MSKQHVILDEAATDRSVSESVWQPELVISAIAARQTAGITPRLSDERGIEMTSELARALRSALDGGTSLAELETTLLTGGGTTEEIDAAWLYAWAYDALCPPRDDLATRSLRHRPPPLRDRALGQPGDLHGCPSSAPRSRRPLRLARDCELDGPAANAPVPLAWSQPRVGWRSFSSDVVNVSGRFVLARVAAVLKASAANSRHRATRLIHLDAKGMLL